MREVPDCLNRRYKALDELIKDLSRVRSPRNSDTECRSECSSEAGIKLMCNFWNILKEDPDCNLTQAVQQRMGVVTNTSSMFGPQRLACYMAGKGKQDDNDAKRKETMNKIKNLCCTGSEPDSKQTCCGSKSVSPSIGSDVLPLSKVLCNLKEAASFDKKCNARITELMATQKDLQDQIQHLEHREKEGVQLLKQADCMWSCMEDTYKKKVAQTLERQKDLFKQLKEVETSAAKWRKNKKDLDLQMDGISKCHQEITEKVNQKTNDIKCIDMETADFKKRIESNKNDTENAKKSLSTKKQASAIKMASIAAEVTRLQKLVSDENKHKFNKERDGNEYVKDARDDLQKICRVLLQKKLENEDLRAEMDRETYKQLMLCLKQVKTVRPSKEDKGTAVKKESCRRWGGTSECNCPKGPKDCICIKKAPPPPQDPTPCPPTQDKEDVVEAAACPHKESTACGPDCAMHAVPSSVGTEVAAWRPDPCREKSCTFSKSMRAAQCVLGPEALCAMPKSVVSPVPFVPQFSTLDDMIMCKCGSTSVKPCACRDGQSLSRERIIEDIMGRYVDVSPIEKVSYSIISDESVNTMH